MGRGGGCWASAPVAPAGAPHEASAVPIHPPKAQRAGGSGQDAWAADQAALPSAAAASAFAAAAAPAAASSSAKACEEAPPAAAAAAAPAAAAPHAAEGTKDAPPTAAAPPGSGPDALSALQRAGGKAAAWEAAARERLVAERADAACAVLGDAQPGQSWPPKMVRRLLSIASSFVTPRTRNEFMRCIAVLIHCSEAALQLALARRSRFRTARHLRPPAR